MPEWEALGERGRGSLPKDRLLVQLGYILDGCDPAEATEFLARMPLLARIAWRLLGRSAYAKDRARILGAA